jgi:uncharacterized repeat protein (TIGR02543 family)
MKRRLNKAVFPALCLLAALAFAGGCNFVMGPDEPEGGDGGNLSISLGGPASPESRAITSGADLPDDVLATLRYDLVLTGPDGGVRNESVSGTEILSMTVAVGAWRIDARAYKEDGLAGTGSLSFRVKPGLNTVWVPMYINGGYFDIAAASPINNGTVTAGCGAAFPGTTITLTVTPEAGYRLKAGTLKYWYGGSGYDPAGSGLIYTFAMPMDNVTVSAEFEALPSDIYSITGTITTDAPPGGLASGAGVQLQQGGTNVGGPVSTDGNGVYTITGVPAGIGYTIEVSLTGYTTGVSSLFDVAGNETGKNLELLKITVPVYTISGTITTNNPGGAAVGAGVQLKQGVTTVGGPVSTDAGGVYTITSVPAGNGYTIEVSLSGYTTDTISSFDITTGNVMGKNLELVRIVYTVSFNSNSGSTTPPDQTIAEGGKAAAPTAPVKTGLTLDGWYKEAALTNLWNFATDTVTGNITLHANWTATVTFNANGGSTTPPTQNIAEGGKAAAPAAPVKTGLTLDGWYKEAALASLWNFATDTVTGDMTLHAKWTATVTFNANGGSATPPIQTIAEGGKAAAPATYPTKTNHVFAGWYKESTCDNPWDFAADTVTAAGTVKRVGRRRPGNL